MKDERHDMVNEILPKYLAGEASVEEEKLLLDWINQHPENKQYYLGYKKVFEISDRHYANKASEDLKIDIDSEWNHFINTVTEAPARKLETENKNYGFLYKIAAAILLVAVSAFVINYFISKGEVGHFETADNTLTISLPDGSNVILNRNSELSYAADFGRTNRKVKLKGEAFFDITRNENAPFTIDVSNAKVEVLGTSFNVRAYDESKEIEVIVKTGVVKLSVPELHTEVKLKAGEKGVYATAKKDLQSTVNKDINFLAWNTRNLVFEENDLRTVIETLNKTYGANIIMATDIPASCVVTVTFDHQTLEAVLHVLETTLNLTYKINGNQIEIISAGC